VNYRLLRLHREGLENAGCIVYGVKYRSAGIICRLLAAAAANSYEQVIIVAVNSRILALRAHKEYTK
jgi:hypothetical protein